MTIDFTYVGKAVDALAIDPSDTTARLQVQTELRHLLESFPRIPWIVLASRRPSELLATARQVQTTAAQLRVDLGDLDLAAAVNLGAFGNSIAKVLGAFRTVAAADAVLGQIVEMAERVVSTSTGRQSKGAPRKDKHVRLISLLAGLFARTYSGSRRTGDMWWKAARNKFVANALSAAGVELDMRTVKRYLARLDPETQGVVVKSRDLLGR